MEHRFEDFHGRLLAFLDECKSQATRDAVVAWILDMVADPDGVEATPVPGLGLATYTSIVPGTSIAVSWTVMKPSTYDVEEPVVTLQRIADLS